MTRAEFVRACHYCMRVWSTSKRGALWDFEEFQSRVLLGLVENPSKSISLHCLHNLRDMQREERRNADIAALVAFDIQRPIIGDVLPATFEVPMPGAGEHGGARKNSGGRRPGAGRKPKA